MQISDPIADMLTRLRNGALARHAFVVMPSSKMKEAIAAILKSEGFIQDYEVYVDGVKKTLRVQLKYTQERQPVMTGLKRISRPGRRVYSSREEIPLVLSGMGIAIMSTPKGVMTGKDARRQGVGGEVLAYVW
ncbi:MAG: 30S ribosomal protein S8 [Anaerolineae bacterium]|jgi:small subunit ribosomal protein S8|nr:30S ribosomal protein S8 [Anaerolineae bacterium]